MRPAKQYRGGRYKREDTHMRWTKPRVEEICVGLEINGYFPPEY
jgi:coenzyme PQQ precursor peptide PqqA